VDDGSARDLRAAADAVYRARQLTGLVSRRPQARRLRGVPLPEISFPGREENLDRDAPSYLLVPRGTN